MGANNGTGQPMYLVCAKCRKNMRRSWDFGWGLRLEATGRTRKRRGFGGARRTNREIEYRCGDCGHVGWSAHIDAERLLRRMSTALIDAVLKEAKR